MPARIRPAACPRCGRASDAWSIERPQGQGFGRAGCPCGEVIDVFFEDDDAHPTRPLATSRKRPARWVEDQRPAGWRATLGPSARPVAALAIGVLMAMLRGLARAVTVTELAVWAAFVFALSAYVLFQRRRHWIFAFEEGRFRADARGMHYDVALEDVLRFDVGKGARANMLTLGGAPFELGVQCRDRRIAVPLFVDDASEAQFIADRANEVLAAEGRPTDRGYRGERIRVEVEPQRVAAEGDADPADDDTEEARSTRARARR